MLPRFLLQFSDITHTGLAYVFSFVFDQPGRGVAEYAGGLILLQNNAVILHVDLQLITLGNTILPSSSTLRIMPVDFICGSPFFNDLSTKISY